MLKVLSVALLTLAWAIPATAYPSGDEPSRKYTPTRTPETTFTGTTGSSS